MPEVSVVIPTHNRRKFLERTLLSARSQNDIKIEIIVVDDGSNDSTATFLREIEGNSIKLIRHQKPLGVSAARNGGIAVAGGKWVAFLDDDDLWSPVKLRRQVDAAHALKRSWVYSGAVTVDSDLRIIGGQPPPSAQKAVNELPYRNIVPAGASNVVVQKEFLDKVGSFDRELRHMADWDLWLRFARQGLPAVVSEPLVAYQIHNDNASMAADQISAEISVIEQKLLAEGCSAEIDKAYIFRWIAWNELRMRKRRGAVKAYLNAVGEGDLTSLSRAFLCGIAPGFALKKSRWDGANSTWGKDAMRWLSQ